MLGLRRGGLADLEQLTQCRPGGVDPLVEEALLNGDQQVVGEHAEEDVGRDAAMELVEDRPLAQRALHVAESVLDAGEQDIETPSLLGREAFAVGLQKVGAIEAQGRPLFS